ncbi:MAG: carboxypeptidase regulatory-like domain-containing protein [Bacteroidia bacterium]
MKKNILFLMSILLITGLTSLNAQSDFGEIKGRLLDSLSKEPLELVSVVALQNSNIVGGSQSDKDGYYSIKPLPNGNYTIKTNGMGYRETQINHVKVNAGKMTYLDIAISTSTYSFIGVDISDYKNPLIDKGQISTMMILETEDIENAPYMDIKQGAALAAGAYQEDDGESIYMRGSREDGTAYYIDGIRVIGDFRLPKSAVKELKVLMGGIPASIGDVTGGVVLITTKGFGNW